MDHIDEYLATAALNADYPVAIKAALAIGKTTLNRYYNKTDHSEIFRIAMGIFFFNIQLTWTPTNFLFNLVLHPKHKLEYFRKAGWEDAWVTRAEEIVRTEFERSYKYSDNLNDIWAETDSTTMVRKADYF
jgi:hypothetical protein